MIEHEHIGVHAGFFCRYYSKAQVNLSGEAILCCASITIRYHFQMWIIIKLAMTFGVFFLRLFAKHFRTLGGPRDNVFDGVVCYVRPKSSKGQIFSTDFGIEFKCNSVFKLTKETDWDRFFKDFGLANELQTGDSEFDRRIYIASDSSAFRDKIKNDPQSREHIKNLFQSGCEYISGDGKAIWIHFKGDKTKDSNLMSSFVKCFQTIASINQESSSFFRDPFALKILFVEAVIWSLAVYAASSFAEVYLVKEDKHLDFYPIAYQGLLVGIFLAVILFTFIVLFLKGSSRGHRILVESFLLLGLAFPAGGIGTISDINSEMDRSNSTFVTAKITNHYRREHRGRKGAAFRSRLLFVVFKLENS